jgi:chloramphenicol O-acetyltransferase
MKCADFVGELFLARDVAHSVHLNTRSYSKHKALRHFYEDVIEAADKFAEAYQGRHGLIGPITLRNARKTANITEFLEDSLKEVEKMRYEVCEKTDTPLQNIIDEIVAVYLSTLYKLKFLA